MSKKMLINASHPGENRVAIVVDGILSELDIELAGQEQTKGNIYKAVVVRVETGLQAAFVDYGAEKLGFLQIGEIHPNIYPSKDDSKSRPRINDILHRNQEILVQIVKEERGNKGAALTTFLSIPGRYMVLMPDSTTKGVSRKISDDTERKKLKKTMAELELPDRMGYIVRTAGIGKEKEELKRDFDYLVRLFEGIVARQDQVKAPAQIYRESNLVIRSIRDYFSTEMDEVLIDNQKVFQDAKDFFSLVMPELAHLVKQHRERRPIFSRYQIEEQIDALSKNQIPLPSGGSIVIDQTEALVAIDVNSGKMSSETGIEATAFKTNLEAAAEVGRQLRLRDLGGLIVIDFIDMRDRKHIREVEQETRKALKDDKAKVTVGRISQFGLLEMSRQRLKPTLSVGAYLECPHCHGIGRIKSAEAQAVALLRQIHAAASKGQLGHIEAKVPIDVANDLHNRKRQSLVELERRLNLKVSILGLSDMLPGHFDLELHKRETSEDNSREILPVSHSNQIEIALAAAQKEDEEKPAVTESDEQESSGDQQETEETTEKKPRKRRRRRRKPRTEGEESKQPTQETTSETDPQTDTPTPAEVTPTAEQGAAEATPQSPGAVTEEKPKRRRPRRSSAKKTTPAPDAGTAADAPKVQAESSAAQEAVVEEKPKRRSPRPAKKQSADSPAGITPENVTQAEALKTEAAAEKPKRPPRRPRKKPPAAVSAEASATEKKATPAVTEMQSTPAEEPALAGSPKPRTRRTPRKKATRTETTPTTEQGQKTAAADNPAPQVGLASDKTQVSQEVAAAPASATTGQPGAEKPKRRPRRTPRKTPAEPVAERLPQEKAAAEKPKRRPGRPRKTPKPAEPQPQPES